MVQRFNDSTGINVNERRKVEEENQFFHHQIDRLDFLSRYILFVSGFLLSETSVIFNQLENFVNGLTKSSEIRSESARKILSEVIRVVVAGNLIDNGNRLKETTNQVESSLETSSCLEMCSIFF